MSMDHDNDAHANRIDLMTARASWKLKFGCLRETPRVKRLSSCLLTNSTNSAEPPQSNLSRDAKQFPKRRRKEKKGLKSFARRCRSNQSHQRPGSTKNWQAVKMAFVDRPSPACREVDDNL